MFVSFSKRLKSMSGFRLGVGLRLTRRNCWYFLFVLVLVGCFYFCWYSVLACGWMLYGLFYGLYLMFKYAAIGTKKLYTCIEGKITHTADHEQGNDKGKQQRHMGDCAEQKVRQVGHEENKGCKSAASRRNGQADEETL